MQLTELLPHWLSFEGRRVGFIFQSPVKREWWQTCFVEKFYSYKSRDGSSNDEWCMPDSQAGIVEACAPYTGHNYQLCNPNHQWQIVGGIANALFETLTVTPSLDGSRGGLWHGFITNGQIVGGI